MHSPPRTTARRATRSRRTAILRVLHSAFRRGIALDGNSAPLYYSLGFTLYASGRKAEAVRALERSVGLDPTLAQPHLALGVLDHEQGEPAKAIRQWQLALRADPSMVIAMDWLAKAYIEAGQPEMAADLLQNAPQTEDLTLDLITAETRTGRYDEGDGNCAQTHRAASRLGHPPGRACDDPGAAQPVRRCA